MQMAHEHKEARAALNDLLDILLDIPTREDAIQSLRAQGVQTASGKRITSDPQCTIPQAINVSLNTLTRKATRGKQLQCSDTKDECVHKLLPPNHKLVSTLRGASLLRGTTPPAKKLHSEAVEEQECERYRQHQGYEKTLKEKQIREAVTTCSVREIVERQHFRPRPPKGPNLCTLNNAWHATRRFRHSRISNASYCYNDGFARRKTLFHEIKMQRNGRRPDPLQLFLFVPEPVSDVVIKRGKEKLKSIPQQKCDGQVRVQNTLVPHRTSCENDCDIYMQFIRNHPLYGCIDDHHPLHGSQVGNGFVVDQNQRTQVKGPPSINSKDFADLVAPVLMLNDRVLARRLFAAFDYNNIGRVSMEEFAIGMSTIRAIDTNVSNCDGAERDKDLFPNSATVCGKPINDKLQLLFCMYDTKRIGSISSGEVAAMLREGYGHFWQQVLFHDSILGCTTSSDVALTYKQFLSVCTSVPWILNAFANGFPLAREHGNVTNAEVLSNEALCNLAASSWETMRILMTRLTMVTQHFQSHNERKGTTLHRRAGVEDSLDYDAFATLMRPFFNKSSALDRKLCARMFAAFDIDGNGFVSPKEFVSQLHLMFRGSPKQQAKFYFFVLDLDNDKVISRDELFHLLAKRTRGTKSRSCYFSERDIRLEVDQIMRNVDSDSDGIVSEPECIEAAERNPGLLVKFERCLFAKRS